MPTPNPIEADRRFLIFNATVSGLALAFLIWLLMFHGGLGTSTVDLRFMPAINAGFNTVATGLLVAAFVAIKRGRADLHQRFAVSAFAASLLFLVGYVAYHFVHGDTRYEGGHRGIYLAILASHVILSITVVPLALSAFYFAAQRRFEIHKRITRFLLPIWLYVSVTGVIIYFFLHG